MNNYKIWTASKKCLWTNRMKAPPSPSQGWPAVMTWADSASIPQKGTPHPHTCPAPAPRARMLLIQSVLSSTVSWESWRHRKMKKANHSKIDSEQYPCGSAGRESHQPSWDPQSGREWGPPPLLPGAASESQPSPSLEKEVRTETVKSFVFLT